MYAKFFPHEIRDYVHQGLQEVIHHHHTMKGPRHWNYLPSNKKRPGAIGLKHVFLTEEPYKIILICYFFTCTH